MEDFLVDLINEYAEYYKQLKKLPEDFNILDGIDFDDDTSTNVSLEEFYDAKYNFEHNNNPIERYNGKLKDRIKVMRGGFGSFERAKAFMNLRRVVHNFVNPHQELQERTPAEEAGIDLELERNKLMSLIEFVRNHEVSLS